MRESGFGPTTDVNASFANSLASASIYRYYILNNFDEITTSGLPPELKNVSNNIASARYAGEFFGYVPNKTGYDIGGYERKDAEDSASFEQTYTMRNMQPFASHASHYIVYGNTLRALGLDAVGTSADGNVRRTLGTIAHGVFLVTLSVSDMFKLLFGLVKAFYPFQFFVNVAQYSRFGLNDAVTASNSGFNSMGAGSVQSSMDSLRTFFSRIFELFLQLGLTVMIPLSIVLFIAGFFLFRRQCQEAGKSIKKIVTKIVFLAVGMPVISSTYTQLLNLLDKVVLTNDDLITTAVASTFVDFESWAINSNLAPVNVNGVTLKAVRDDKTDFVIPAYGTWQNLHQMAVGINTLYSNTNMTYDDTNKNMISAWTGDLQYPLNAVNQATNKISNVLSIQTDKIVTPSMQRAYRILMKYQNADTISAADYASAVKASLPAGIESANMPALSSTPLAFSTGSRTQINVLGSGTSNVITVGGGGLENNKSPWQDVAKHRFGSSGLNQYELGDGTARNF
jgi:hypothetical protein